jgi:hypothetical protein
MAPSLQCTAPVFGERLGVSPPCPSALFCILVTVLCSGFNAKNRMPRIADAIPTLVLIPLYFAATVLEVISRTLEQLMAYNARLKFQRDEVAKILQAGQEGEEIGEARGRIVILQELLGQQVWTAEDFAQCDAAQLNALADQLQQQLRVRNS